MTDLSGAGVRALLIGTATHRGPLLPSVPSVARSFHDLRTVLIERCGVRPDRMTAVLDPPDAQTMARAVAEAAQQADTVLLVYFIGHGLLGPDGELYLAAAGTDRLTPGMAEHQALSVSSLRQALRASRASSVVVVLDCCFSGRATLGGGPTLPAFTMSPAPGLYLLGSAEQLAHAPENAEHTAFTGAFIDLLTDGDPRGPHALTLDAAYDALFRTLGDRQRPLPQLRAGDRSGQLVIALNPAHTPTPEEIEPPVDGRCPYPGLGPFAVAEADVFFGRAAMTERVRAAVEQAVTEPGPLILVGSSGSGKTSLLNAGLLARLRDDGVPGSARWSSRRLTPGKSPLRSLAAQLDPEAAAAPEAAASLREDPDRAVALVHRLLADRPGERLIVLVDQLEELFTLCSDPSEQTAFLRALTAIARPNDDQAPGALVVLALRADFYAQAAAQPDLLAVLSRRQLLVEPMTAEELRASIEKPAAAAGWSLDDGLADLILHELGGTAEGQHPAAALPLLSHVLQQTWKNRAGKRLTVSGYRATGGIARAIATTAENVYDDQLDQDGREAVRLMLPRLVRVGEGVADTAQPVRRSALLHGLPDTEVAQGAIKQLADARLLTLERDTVRISHEALLRAWPELQTWVDADRDWLRARQQLADGAVAWQRSGRDPSLLYRGNRLNTLRELAAQTPARTADLDPGLAEFLGTSWRQERRGARIRRIAVAILTALAVLATAGLVGAVVFQRQAEQARQRDLARYLAAEAEDLRDQQPGLAKQLSLLAFQINHDAGRGALLNSQRTPGVINAQEAAHDLAYSADGRVLAISTGDSIVLRAGSDSGRIRADAVGPIAVSHDGRTLSAVTYSSRLPNTATVRLWDISDPVHPRQTAALNENHAVTALALSTDGTTLFGGVSTGAILVWNISDRSTPTALPPLPGHSEQVDSLAVSPRRGLLASLSVDGRILLWNVADPGHPQKVGALTASPYSSSSVFASPLHRLAFDRTGLLLAAPVPAKSGDALGLWRLNDPRAPRRIAEDSSVSPDTCYDSLTSLAFSPAHDQLVGLCGEDWHAWLYSTDSDPGVIVSGTSMTVQGSSLESGTVVFDPSKSRRLLQTTDRGVLVWYLSNAAQPGASDFVSLTPGTGGQMAFRAAGRNELLAVQGIGVNDLVDVTPGREKRLLATTPAPDMFTGSGIALSPDGSILADIEVYPGTKPKTQNVGVRLRDTAHPTGPPLATIGDELVDGVQAIAFSPTQPLLAVSDLNGWNAANRSTPMVRLFDISDPRHPRQVGSFASTSPSIAFSPDGRTLVTEESPLGKPKNSWLTTGARLVGRDLTDPAHPTTLWTQQLKPEVTSAYLAFRTDGKLLAAYQSNGTLLLWHVDGERPTGAPVSVAIGEYGGPIAFTPDGTHLALIDQNITTDASEGDRPEIWDLSNPDDPVRESYLPMSPGSSLYALAYSPNGRLLAILRASAGVDLWDTTPDPVISDLCNAVGDPITRQQWKRYLPDRPYQPPCPPG